MAAGQTKLDNTDVKEHPNSDAQLKQELNYGRLSWKTQSHKVQRFCFNAKSVLSYLVYSPAFKNARQASGQVPCKRI